MAGSETLYSIGAVAKRLGYSISNVVKLEREGILPPALRLEGSNRRVYRGDQIDQLEERLKQRRANRLRSAAA